MQRLFLLILLLAAGGACRNAPDNPATATPALTTVEREDQVVVTLAVEEFNLSRYRPLMEQFEQEHPHIRVRLVSTSDLSTLNDAGEVQAMASSFDVFPYNLTWQGDTQYLLNLRPLLALDAQFDRDDFLPGLLPGSQEPLWAIPIGAAYQLTYFHKSAFNAASLPHPELEWTLEDFLTSALRLTTQEGSEVIRWGYIPVQLRHAPLVATQLTGLLGVGDELRLTDPDVTAAVQWVSDLFTLHGVSPWLEIYKPTERRSGSREPSSLVLISSGMAAMWHNTHVLFDKNNEDIGVAAVPRGPHGFAAEPIVTGFAISGGTRNPEAAWQLLHFLSRQPPQDGNVFAVSSVPARRSVAAATRYWEQLPAELAPVLQYTAENSMPPRITYQAADLLQEVFAVHIDDNIPVVAALEQSVTAVSAVPSPAAAEVVVELSASRRKHRPPLLFFPN